MKDPLVHLTSILQRPGILALPNNLPWIQGEGADRLSVRRLSSGHAVVYGPHGKRILLIDPEGHPLHECEWVVLPGGAVRFLAARLFLDWDQWVGIKPRGLINTMTLNLSARPGWEGLTSQDLRVMASKAMGMPLEEVEFFYTDDDLIIEPSGLAKIQQRKDVFYELEDGTFEHAHFLSCMSAMHWEAIDYLPVVELFKSLLPGTGSATFELIRGLYDDQNPRSPRPLHYRGIPPYPSEAAFGLFCNFFTPSHPGPENLFTVFMDPSRSHEVSWLPNREPPVRYVDPSQHVCVTVKQGRVHKVTISTDPTGLSYTRPDSQGFVPCGRSLTVKDNQLLLQDEESLRTLTLNPSWSIRTDSSETRLPPIPKDRSWRSLFPEGVPCIDPKNAYAAVLRYPEDDSEIEEYPSQPFVADFLDDLFEEKNRWEQPRAQAKRVFVYGFDASFGTCTLLDQPRPHTFFYTHAPLAQKQAQILWNQLARSHRFDWLSLFRFYPANTHHVLENIDWVYYWIPFADFSSSHAIQRHLEGITRLLTPQGKVFVTGPASLPASAEGLSLRILFGEKGTDLQPFLMHQSILPRSQLNPDLHIWCLQKR